eukprot:4738986-Alexandrium_andersonii.AAC.1
MSASLVGSEMCIRDRDWALDRTAGLRIIPGRGHMCIGAAACPVSRGRSPVSYTHLTLPTICSV